MFVKNNDGGMYNCVQKWQERYFMQCGLNGTVIEKERTYSTAYFQVFITNPKTFIRGEGKTIEDAEKIAWDQFQTFNNCPGHEFERRGIRNGGGYCKHCGLFQVDAFNPSENCSICGTPTYWIKDKDGNWYCKECALKIPEESKRILFAEIKK